MDIYVKDNSGSPIPFLVGKKVLKNATLEMEYEGKKFKMYISWGDTKEGYDTYQNGEIEAAVKQKLTEALGECARVDFTEVWSHVFYNGKNLSEVLESTWHGTNAADIYMVDADLSKLTYDEMVDMFDPDKAERMECSGADDLIESMIKKEMIAMLLAGGQGSRLGVLTAKVAKPAVSFGGKYRIIDFPLSNCANSGINIVGVCTQYESTELDQYLGNGEKWGLNGVRSLMGTLAPRQTEDGANWYKGTADAIYQNYDFINDLKENMEE